jgi:hypothetical protein
VLVLSNIASFIAFLKACASWALEKQKVCLYVRNTNKGQRNTKGNATKIKTQIQAKNTQG